jgi:hypothetical protein
MLNGFKFCHHCGRTVNSPSAAPELTAQIPPREAAMPELQTPPQETAMPELQIPPQEAAVPELQTPPREAAKPEPELKPESAQETEPGPEASETDPFDSVIMGLYKDRRRPKPEITVGGMYVLELLCRIPILNIFLLAIIASSTRENPMREIARAKLLTLLTVAALILLAALIVVFLLYADIIEPFYLGRWNI